MAKTTPQPAKVRGSVSLRPAEATPNSVRVLAGCSQATGRQPAPSHTARVLPTDPGPSPLLPGRVQEVLTSSNFSVEKAPSVPPPLRPPGGRAPPASSPALPPQRQEVWPQPSDSPGGCPSPWPPGDEASRLS